MKYNADKKQYDISHLDADALGDFVFNDEALVKLIFHKDFIVTLKLHVKFSDKQLGAFLDDRADYEDDLNEGFKYVDHDDSFTSDSAD